MTTTTQVAEEPTVAPAIAYAVVISIAIGVYTAMISNPDPNVRGELIGNRYDLWITVGIVALGWLAAKMRGSAPVVAAIGIVGIFIILTISQTPLVRFLTLGAALFSIGMYGMVASRNAVRVLMSIELMLNAVNINLIAFARYVDPGTIKGQLFAIFILTVAAAEAAVGLAIVLSMYRNMSTVDMDKFNLLKW